jgi:hypothetical protein
VLSSPVWVWGTVIGNLDAIRIGAHRWTETETRANEAYAKVVSVTLDLAVQTVDAGRNHQPEPGLRPDLPDTVDREPDKGP